MRITMTALALAGLLAALPACGDDAPAAGTDTAAAPDTPSATDPGAETADHDVTADLGPGDIPTAPDVDPGAVDVPAPTEELWAGAAFRSFQFPIGVPNVGLAPGAGVPSRFADSFPGTEFRHTDVGAKALVLRRQGTAVVLVRLDLIGIWDTNRDEVAQMLTDVGRADLGRGLILGATHTHASGGRLMAHPIIELAVDTFMPGLYQRVRQAIFDAVVAADAAAVPAKVGHAVIQVPELHHDRRCENGPVQDDSMGLIKVEDAADGRVLAVVVNYAMHPTVIGNDLSTLSSDASGAIEHGVEEALPGAPPVIYFQSWAGDMAPARPAGYATEPAGDHLRAETAAAARDLIVPALAGIATSATPELAVETIRYPLSMALISPGTDFADKYPWGAAYCFSTSENCPDEGGVPYTKPSCFPFEEEFTLKTAQTSAARIGDLGLATIAGEPLTSLGVELRDRGAAVTGLTDFFVIGYGNGYMSYLLHPDDFWMGGYEGGSAMLGPDGGQYLVDKGVAIAERMMNPNSDLGFEPIPFAWGEVVDYGDLDVEEALGAAAIVSQPTSDGPARSVTWIGGDTAADAPTVTLERQEGGAWAPALRANGAPYDSWGPEMELRLGAEPVFGKAAPAGTPRTFTWTCAMPALFAVPPLGGQLTGTFRFAIAGTRPDPYTLTSDPFTL
jgi:hypothetical protein